MKKRRILKVLALFFMVEVAMLLLFAFRDTEEAQDVVLVNEAVHTVQAEWGGLDAHEGHTGLDYVVLDADGNVLFRTREGLSESIYAAVSHRDTMLDIQVDGQNVGRVIFYNDSESVFRERKRVAVLVLTGAMLAQCVICVGYVLYLDRAVLAPFQKLKGFAERIAGGNLDIPLEMDRRNLFGAFTESFDLMRSELKRARRAEAEANAGKKELVAKLSHDIKTPVASIKAASEVGAALTEEARLQDNYAQIIRKADQIDALISNLFSATLEELEQLAVTPRDMESGELEELLGNADYLHRAVIPRIPECILCADRLRLQQVFDNIFANSYKYGGSEIRVAAYREDGRLAVCIEDTGGGVDAKELPLLKEKFKRGSNVGDAEGAGLGLYISDFFLREMQGELLVENGREGLRVTVCIPLSGRG